MRLVQNVQIVIILRDILINFPDFIEETTMTMTMTMTNLTEHRDTETQSFLKQ